MTQIQWQQLEATVAGMTDLEKQKLASLLATAGAVGRQSPASPSLGLFADDPELIDEIMEGVYAARESHALRMDE